MINDIHCQSRGTFIYKSFNNLEQCLQDLKPCACESRCVCKIHANNSQGGTLCQIFLAMAKVLGIFCITQLIIIVAITHFVKVLHIMGTKSQQFVESNQGTLRRTKSWEKSCLCQSIYRKINS